MFALFLALSLLVAGDLSPPEFEKTRIENLWSQDNERAAIFKDLTGQEIKWPPLKGKIIVVSLWATWCSPCIRELSSFEKLYKKYKVDEKESGIIFMFVSSESEESINNLLRKKYYHLPICILKSEDFLIKKHNDANNGGRIPATYIIVPESNEVYYFVGPAKWDDGSVVEFLNKLLNKN